MSKDIENLSEALDQLYSEESTESEVKTDVEPEIKEEKVIEVEKEDKKAEEPDLEAQEEDEKEIPEIEEDLELNRKLSGQPKEFIDIVKSVKDPEVQAMILEAGKIARAREDKVRFELGHTKKELAGASGLLKLLETDPALAIKHIAKAVKVDLGSLVEKPVVEDEYDYRTPEEKARDVEFKDIKQEISELKNQKAREELITINREIEDFSESKDDKGNLKFPHFERVHDSMFDILGAQNQRLGFPKTSAERMERLRGAYQKAILLDDELVSVRDADLLKREAEKRKEQVEKIKSLKKFSGGSSSSKTAPSLTPLDANKEALSQLFG